MFKIGYPIILICLLFAACFGAQASAVEGHAGDIEISEISINYSQYELPRFAYLCMELKNNGDKKIANLDLEVSYYDEEDYPIKKVVLKNRLTEAIPPKESRKCKIRLTGDVFNERNEEYPFSQSAEVAWFDVKILDVKFAQK